MGIIVQPIVGTLSDRTWTRLGRRIPYLVLGAAIAVLVMCLLPNAGSFGMTVATAMIFGLIALMFLDTSLNMAMQPFKMLVGDMVNEKQKAKGYAIQSFLCNAGSVMGFIFPFVFALIGIANIAPKGMVPDTVVYSFYVGAAILILCVIYSVIKVKEWPPKEYEEYNGEKEEEKSEKKSSDNWITLLRKAPSTFWKVGLVQFFSWFALFSMWVYMVPAVADHLYGTTDNTSHSYADAGDWVGILQGVYNGVAAIFAFLLPFISKKFSRKGTHALCLLMGAIGFLSFYFIKDPRMLVFPMIGVGMAWAGILAMPYSILAGALPAHKMGVYMGIFNFFITIPQIINGLVGGVMVKHLYGGKTIFAMVFSGFCLLIAAISVFFVEDRDDPVQLAFRKNRKIGLSN